MTASLAAPVRLPIDRRRFFRIIAFFGPTILRVIAWDVLLRRLLPTRVLGSRAGRWRRHARDFRHLAVDMGGVLIKLGQFLSARVDVLPPEITDELQGLQDEVPAEAPGAILSVMRQELGDLDVHFAAVDEAPLAAASLGQAHRGWLWPEPVGDESGAGRGRPVVIKVLRPGIEGIVLTDLEALKVVARWIMRYRPIARRADVPALLEEFAETLWEELDYVSEAENARRFRRMFAGDDRVYIPEVVAELSTGRVITLEDVSSIKITDLNALDDAGIDLAELADRLLDVYFHMIFREGFFHADPHPGNLFVRPRVVDRPMDDVPVEGAADAGVDEAAGEADDADEAEEDSAAGGPCPYELIFVDFGMVGEVRPDLLANMHEVLISVSRRDARSLTEAYRQMGFFLPSADLERIEEAQTVLLDQIWGRKLLDLARPDPREVQDLGRQFRDILFDFPFQIPRDFIYLGRCLGMLSGLTSLLDPQINPWHYVEKYGRELIATEAGQELGRESLWELVRPFVTLPGQLQRTLEALESGQLRLQMAPDRVTARRLERLESRVSRLHWSILGAAGLISATLLWTRRGRARRGGRPTRPDNS